MREQTQSPASFQEGSAGAPRWSEKEQRAAKEQFLATWSRDETFVMETVKKTQADDAAQMARDLLSRVARGNAEKQGIKVKPAQPPKESVRVLSPRELLKQRGKVV